MVEVSLTVFRERLVLKWRAGWAEAAAGPSAAGRLLFSMAELKPRACNEAAVRRSVSCRSALAVEWQGSLSGVVVRERRSGGEAYLRPGSGGGELPPGTFRAKAGNILGQVDGGTLGGEQRGRKGRGAGHV